MSKATEAEWRQAIRAQAAEASQRRKLTKLVQPGDIVTANGQEVSGA